MPNKLLENPCPHTAYMREYLRIPANREKHNARTRASHQKARRDVFAHYGEACACCGEAHSEFLTIDHVDGGGRSHRKQIGRNGGMWFYGWLRRQGYPAGYRTLCFNCNAVTRPGKPCPHERDYREAVSF